VIPYSVDTTSLREQRANQPHYPDMCAAILMVVFHRDLTVFVCNFYCRIHKPKLICRGFSNSLGNAHVQKFLIHKFSYLDVL
jgi:hypothetical protein